MTALQRPIVSLLSASVLLALSGVAAAEIEKIANVCEQQICFYWWPKLPPPAGWHHEPEPSRKHHMNVLAPDGSSFSDAETIIYARALYKPDLKGMGSVDDVVADDKKGFAEHAPPATVADVEPLVTGDGQKLRSITFFPKEEGNWEIVAYGVEGDYYLMFTMSSRTQRGYKEALPIFAALLHAYKEKPGDAEAGEQAP